MSKRRRVAGGGRAAARPIDKQLIFVLLEDINATQQTTTLFTATSPCTVMGIRWTGHVQGDAGTVGNKHDYEWAIVKVNDGDGAANNIDRTNGGKFYVPEQNVVAFGVGSDNASSTSTTGMQVSPRWEGTTKSMRKYRVGDKLNFIIRGIAVDTVRCRFSVQFFCKS